MSNNPEKKGVSAIGFGAIVGVGWAVAINGWMTSCGGPIPAAIGYIVALVMMIPIALCYCELVPMLPVAGGGMAFSYRAFNENVSFISGWAAFGAFVSIIPWEAIQITDVLGYLIPDIKSGEPLYQIAGTDVYLVTIIIGSVASLLLFALNMRGLAAAAGVQKILCFILVGAAIIGAVAAILIFVGALMFILFSSLFSDTLGPNQNSIRVPSVVGMMFDQAKNDQELLGEFTLEQAGEAVSEKPAGTILDQDPGANSLVSSSGTIRVTVSSGPADEVLMPDLTNVPLQSALSQLNGLGEFDIDFTSRTDYDDHIPKDSVISTIPAKDQPLTEGTKIYLTISLGKKEETVPMIDLRGMTQEQAEKAIVGLGLTVGTGDHSSSDMPAGQVWFQSVEPKDEVAPGTKVNIIISTGSAGGSQQNSKTITFNLPDSGEIVSVQVIDSSGNTVWGPEEKDTNREVAVEVTVSGSGTEEFTLLVNGSAYSTKTVDFEAE